MDIVPERHKYAGHLDFYAKTYPAAVDRCVALEACGGAMIQAKQGVGDWSDAATPDLIIAMNVASRAPGTADLGAGRFQSAFNRHEGIVFAPHAPSTIYMGKPHVTRTLAVPYDRYRALVLDDELGLPADGDFRSFHAGSWSNAELADCLNRLWHEATHGSPLGPMYAQGLLLQIGAILTRLSQVPPAKHRGGLTGPQVARVTDHMLANLDRDIELAEISAVVGLSPFHFRRAFKASLGCGTHTWLTNARIERSQALMRSAPTLTLLDIALAVGYRTQGSFALAFRRVTRQSPSQWRAENVRGVAAARVEDLP